MSYRIVSVAAVAFASLVSLTAPSSAFEVFGIKVFGHPATPPSAAPQELVSYSDLNLSSQAGVKVLLGRIGAASAHVCGPAPAATDLSRTTVYHGCVKQAQDNAVMKINQPLVTQMYGAVPVAADASEPTGVSSAIK